MYVCMYLCTNDADREYVTVTQKEYATVTKVYEKPCEQKKEKEEWKDW